MYCRFGFIHLFFSLLTIYYLLLVTQAVFIPTFHPTQSRGSGSGGGPLPDDSRHNLCEPSIAQ